MRRLERAIAQPVDAGTCFGLALEVKLPTRDAPALPVDVEPVPVAWRAAYSVECERERLLCRRVFRGIESACDTGVEQLERRE